MKLNRIRKCLSFTSSLLFLSLTSCQITSDKVEIVPKISFEKEVYEVVINKTVKLEYTISPDKEEELTFTSNDESVATVTPEGEVTGIKIGFTQIRVRSLSGIDSTVDIRVVYAKAEKINLNIQKLSLIVGEDQNLRYTTTPNKDTNANLFKWYISDPEIVSIYKNNVTALKEGTSEITMYYDANENDELDKGEASSTCYIAVNDPDSDKGITHRVVDVHKSYTEKQSTFLEFFDDQSLIPYIEGRQIVKLFNYCHKEYNHVMSYRREKRNHIFTFNDSDVIVNSTNNTITYQDYLSFSKYIFDVNNHLNGDPALIYGIVKDSTNTKVIQEGKKNVVLDLASYDLPFKVVNNHVYIPFDVATISLISEYDTFAFNGEQIFMPNLMDPRDLTFFYSSNDTFSFYDDRKNLIFPFTLTTFRKTNYPGDAEADDVKYYYTSCNPLTETGAQAQFINGKAIFKNDETGLLYLTLTNNKNDFSLTNTTPLEFVYYESEDRIRINIAGANITIQKKDTYHNMQTIPKSLREYNYNLLCFKGDYFYGAKEEKGITTSFDEYFKSKKTPVYLQTIIRSSRTLLWNKTIYDYLTTTVDPKQYDAILTSLIYTTFDEFHTNILIPSIIGGVCQGVVVDNNAVNLYAGDKRFAVNNKLKSYLDIRSDKNSGYNNGIAGMYPTFGREGNTAIFQFDNFIGPIPNNQIDYSFIARYHDSELVNHSTYYALRNFFNNIANDYNIKNVVLDVTCNRGGQVALLPIVLAYMTDDPFLVIKGNREESINEYHYNVDLNVNGKLGDDSYKDRFNFYVLTSECTFSCGSAFVAACKNNNCAKIIGTKTGGGSYFMGYTSDCFGSSLTLSSSRGFLLKSGDNYSTYENGIEPDYNVSNYSSFNSASSWYDFSKVNEFINLIQQQ